MKFRKPLPSAATGIAFGVAILLVNGASALGQEAKPQTPDSRPATPVSIVQSVPLAVTVDSGINVTGTVNVRDVDVAARSPFQAATESAISVPADKRLTIEFATVVCSSPSTEPLHPGTYMSVSVTSGGVFIEHELSAEFKQDFSGRHRYVGNHLVRLYADPGTTVSTLRNAGFQCKVQLSGYLSPE